MSAISSSILATVVRTAQGLAGAGVIVSSATVIAEAFDSLEAVELAYALDDEFPGLGDGVDTAAGWTRTTTLKDVADALERRVS